MKKALLIGINYSTNPANRLNGCINDTINMQELLVSQLGYSTSNITVLRDDKPLQQPTRAKILAELTKIVADSSKCTEIWVCYSGHGTQITDKNRDETDGLDEVIVPVDYLSSGFISDDEINKIIQNAACRAVFMFDSCRSGTVCDLPWCYDYKSPSSYVRRGENNKLIKNQDIYMFSGCKDNQTSADAFSRKFNQYSGAFTSAFIESMKSAPSSIGILLLYRNVCMLLQQQKFTQMPVLSSYSSIPNMVITKVKSSSLISGSNVMANIINMNTSVSNKTTELVSVKNSQSILSMNIFPRQHIQLLKMQSL
jgi:hypothetical protein